MMKSKKNIDFSMFIFLSVILLCILSLTILNGIVEGDTKYLLFLIPFLMSVILIFVYLIIRKTWFLYICIAPIYNFYVFLAGFNILFNYMNLFTDFFVFSNSLIIPLTNLAFLIFLTMKIMKGNKTL